MNITVAGVGYVGLAQAVLLMLRCRLYPLARRAILIRRCCSRSTTPSPP
jgi:hypothetical protein